MAQGAVSYGSGRVLPGVLTQFQELFLGETGDKLQLVGGHVGVGSSVLVHSLNRNCYDQLCQ